MASSHDLNASFGGLHGGRGRVHDLTRNAEWWEVVNDSPVVFVPCAVLGTGVMVQLYLLWTSAMPTGT